MSLREIVLDVETTGLEPAAGHRIVELACLELVNHVPTGRQLRWYINPDRDMPEEAFAIHGLSLEFLADKPCFAEIVEEFLAFVGEDPLVIHNAGFDVGFLNAELALLKLPPIAAARALDTLQMARRKFPGAPASLDALCKRFGIDNAARTLHGALLDCELLAEVYLELVGGRQPELLGTPAAAEAAAAAAAVLVASIEAVRPPRPHAPSAEELAAHTAMLALLKDPIWVSEDR